MCNRHIAMPTAADRLARMNRIELTTPTVLLTSNVKIPAMIALNTVTRILSYSSNKSTLFSAKKRYRCSAISESSTT